MPNQPKPSMRLYNQRDERLYLNHTEWQRFVRAAYQAPLPQRQFALTLAYTGMRLSEARSLRCDAIQLSERLVSVRTLKRRGEHVCRELPLPRELVDVLSIRLPEPHQLLWSASGKPIPRITAYRWIKSLMDEAQIDGAKACPKGLRHAFGTRAILAGVPLHMLQLWMGHASMRTTAIYATVMGQEQLALSDQMW